ncbi:MAG: pyridoxal phosphate-dependent aminotransferase [Pseudomonadota bacterium]
MSGPSYTPLVQKLPATVPFVGPEEQERARGAPFAARLGANESLFGPSPEAVRLMQEHARDLWMYGDPTSFELREALAAHHGVTPQNIIVGEGIDGLLGNLVRLLIGPGDAVVTSDGSYPTFNYHVLGFGGALHKVPYTGGYEDPYALFARAAEIRAKLVYLSNPDNPMGSWHTGDALIAALDDLPKGCLLVLDEAYVELAPQGTAPALPSDDPRVIRMRTFSKAYGLAGARVGYAIGAPDLIGAFDKIRNHFGMNRLSQIGALAALRDEAWLTHVKQSTKAAREQISSIARACGLTPLASATNFVAVDCGQDGVYARAVLEELLKRGVFARMPGVAPLDRCIRISCGPGREMQLLKSALPDARAAADAALSRKF